ncbi:MAG: DUF4956 domain-containing protein [Rikenellaceae bacterium]
MMTQMFMQAADAVEKATKKPTPWIETLRFLDIKLINISDFLELFLRFSLNLAVLMIIVQFIYARNSRRKDFYFSYLAVGVITFLLCGLLNSVKLEMGFALGLFAIFGIIRYRTDAIPIKEMTYLFLIIGVSVINALANKKVSYAELLFTNAVIVGGIALLESRLKLKQEGPLRVIYDNVEMIHSDHHEELLQELIQRTGIEIERFEIEKIDYLKDVAIITVYYHAGCNGYSQVTSKQNNSQDYDEN